MFMSTPTNYAYAKLHMGGDVERYPVSVRARWIETPPPPIGAPRDDDPGDLAVWAIWRDVDDHGALGLQLGVGLGLDYALDGYLWRDRDEPGDPERDHDAWYD